jgi:hypothetical protein
MATRVARVIRGLIVTFVALAVAASAHAAVGGRIGEFGLVLAFVFSAMLSIGLAGRTVSRVRMVISVVLGQGAFHALFGLGVGYNLIAVSARHGMDMSAASVTLPVGATGGTSMATMQDTAWMWLAHGAAALVTAAALVLGEKTFWELSGRVSLALTRAFTLPSSRPVTRPRPPSIDFPRLSARTRLMLSSPRRRGPPRALAST